MIVGGVFLAGCGMIGALMAMTARDWRERMACGCVALALIIGGVAVLAG